VRDVKHGSAQLISQVADQVDDLRFKGDIKRGCRLVGDEQRRVRRQSDGNHDPLAHPA